MIWSGEQEQTVDEVSSFHSDVKTGSAIFSREQFGGALKPARATSGMLGGANSKIAWTPTDLDTSHVALSASSGRGYSSMGWGLQRKDSAA